MKLRNILLLFFSLVVQDIFAQSVTVIYGSYAGSASTQTVTGLGFQPDLIIIKGGSTGAYVKTGDMASNESRLWANGSGLVTTKITGLTSSGFIVGGNQSGVNTSGTTFYFIAISSSFTGLETHTYSGNGSGSKRNIALQGGGNCVYGICVPDGAGSDGGGVTCKDGSAYAEGYTTGASSSGSSNTSGASASGIDIYPNFNSSGVTYYYAAFKTVATKSLGNSYAGSTSTQTISTTFRPNVVMITEGSGYDVSFTTAKLQTNTSFFSATAAAASRISNITSSGFVVTGSATNVNENIFTYYFMALGGSEVAGLPIELFHFDARCTNGKSVDINWTTVSEVNNDYFTIERSVDGVNFDAIATMAGSGNSNQRLDYYYEDESPVPGVVNYYRLKQTDYDGKSETFHMMAASCEDQEAAFKIDVLQNPITDDGIVYNFTSDRSGLVNMKLVSMSGQVMDDHTFYHRKGIATYYREESELAPGVYLMTINNGVTQKTVKIFKP